MTNEKPENRRQFLLASGRYLGLGSLASLITFEELKGRRLEGDPKCLKLYTCNDCIEFQACSKPKAERFRLNTG